MGVQLIAPDLIQNVSWLQFGRIRPIHTTTNIFGFAGSGLLGAAFYLVPFLVRAPLYSDRLGVWTAVVWNAAIIYGDVNLALGYSQAREYAEWVFGADVLIVAGLVLVFYNLTRTVMQRREKILYVSIWYIFATLIFTFFIYSIGNVMWNPRTGATYGIPDGIVGWFYGHGIVGLFLTPAAVGIAYFVIPIVSQRPIFSHTLGLIGFWSLLVFYPEIGTHHLLQAPAPTWLKVVAITGSGAMFLPVFAALTNLFWTFRGQLGRIHADIGGKLVFAGLIWYLFTCVQGPFQSLPFVQKLTHLTNWVVAHSHIGVLGFSGFIALGGMYFIIPRITGRSLYSPHLADLQYWFLLLGLSFMFIALTIAGLIQGNSWLNGEVVYRTLPPLYPYFLVRTASGVFIFAGAALGLYNILRSLYGTIPFEEKNP